MTVKKSDRVFTCKQDFLAYLNITDHLFKKFIRAGMPAVLEDGRWYGHADNIDEWFKRKTLISVPRNIPDDEI